MATRLSRIAIHLGKCAVHGEPVWCVRCVDLDRLSPGEAAVLASLCRRISAEFTPGPEQPPCPRCRGIRLCPRCNGATCLTEAEQMYCAALLGKLMVRRQR